MKRKADLKTFLLLVAGILAWALTAGAQELPLSGSMRDLPWNLKAQRLEVDQENKVVHARDRVVLSREQDTLQADYVRYYWETKWVYLRGNVRMNWGGDELKAQEAEFDLENKVGWLQQGQVFFKKSHMYLKGEKMRKTGPKTYEFEQATVTSCDGDSPDWSLKTSRGSLRVNGYARLWHSRFRVKDQPLLYSPYLLLPANRKRTSGFLIPEVGYSSEHGAEVNLPYYQILSEEQDLTLYLNSLSKRGIMVGGEHRMTPNPLTKGLFRADWLQDSEVSETEAEESSQFDDDGLIRPNDDRFWVRSKYDGFVVSPSWRTKLDIDYVSDQNYLREFDKGYSGFEQSREDFLQAFGRDIDDQDDLTRSSVWTVTRNWGNYGLGSRFEYTQNLAYMNDNRDSEDNPTLQRLPELTFDAYKQNLGETPLEWRAENELTHFWREKWTTGTRLDLYPGLSLPLHSAYGSIISSFNWRETLYLLDQTEDDPAVTDAEQTRGIWDFQISGLTSISKIYGLTEAGEVSPGPETLGSSKWTKIKHTLQPRLKYRFVPEKDQEGLPDFDSLDDIDQENRLTYSLTSYLTARVDSVVNRAQKNRTQYENSFSYLDFCRFKLEQSYDFNEADRDENLAEYPDTRPFSDIRAELTLKPVSWFFLESNTWFSPYERVITEYEHMLRLRKDRYQVYFGYDFQRKLDDINHQDQDELKILRVGGRLDLGSAWSLYLNYEKDLVDSELIKQEIGVEYQKQCWGGEIRYFHSEEETRVSLMINLLNLGGFQQAVAVAD